jgi:hypothetical protein
MKTIHRMSAKMATTTIRFGPNISADMPNPVIATAVAMEASQKGARITSSKMGHPMMMDRCRMTEKPSRR